MSAQRRPRRLAATAGRGAARLAGEVPNATGCPSAQRAAAENADTAIALRPVASSRSRLPQCVPLSRGAGNERSALAGHWRLVPDI
jgi:hypothetical protein